MGAIEIRVNETLYPATVTEDSRGWTVRWHQSGLDLEASAPGRGAAIHESVGRAQVIADNLPTDERLESEAAVQFILGALSALGEPLGQESIERIRRTRPTKAMAVAAVNAASRALLYPYEAAFCSLMGERGPSVRAPGERVCK